MDNSTLDNKYRPWPLTACLKPCKPAWCRELVAYEPLQYNVLSFFAATYTPVIGEQLNATYNVYIWAGLHMVAKVRDKYTVLHPEQPVAG